MLTNRNVRIITESAGVEYPDQSAMIRTPYGRGRVVPEVINVMATSRRNRPHRNTSRCRQRRNAIVSATADSPTTVAPQPEQAAEIPLATSVSHGVRARAKNRSTTALT